MPTWTKFDGNVKGLEMDNLNSDKILQKDLERELQKEVYNFGLEILKAMVSSGQILYRSGPDKRQLGKAAHEIAVGFILTHFDAWEFEDIFKRESSS